MLTVSQISNIRKLQNSIPLRLTEISVWVLIFMDAWTLNFTVTPVRTATLNFIGAEKAWTIFTSQRCPGVCLALENETAFGPGNN